MFPSILIVDDEPSILRSLSGLLADDGFEVSTAANGYEALKVIEAESPDLVLLDIWMPGIDGIETLKEIKKDNPFIQVIIITGHGTIESAVKATKLGAFDLIEKPLSIDKVVLAINNALNFRRLEEENRYLRKKAIEKHSINGNSPPTLAVKKQIAVVAPTDAWVLIRGENGTGKELVARTIHQLSSRVDQPIIEVNCAALPDEFVQTELFGHEKRAFKHAKGIKRGKFELANNGTIFFDEIGDMSLKTQAIILRVLQEQKLQRVGGSRILNINVRVIAATNKDLEKEIKLGNFREDLYYRLHVVPIDISPLRDRTGDIPLLVETFLNEQAKQNKCDRKKIDKKALEILCSYSWPGNVRELKNLVERLSITSQSDIINVSDIPSQYHSGIVKNIETEEKLFYCNDLKNAKKRFEKEFIIRKFNKHNNQIAKTAKAIGVTQHYLQKLLKDIKN